MLLALPFAIITVLTKGVKSLVLMDKVCSMYACMYVGMLIMMNVCGDVQLHKFLCKFPFGQTLFSLMVGIASPYNASIRPRFIKLEKDECKVITRTHTIKRLNPPALRSSREG